MGSALFSFLLSFGPFWCLRGRRPVAPDERFTLSRFLVLSLTTIDLEVFEHEALLTSPV